MDLLRNPRKAFDIIANDKKTQNWFSEDFFSLQFVLIRSDVRICYFRHPQRFRITWTQLKISYQFRSVWKRRVFIKQIFQSLKQHFTHRQTFNPVANFRQTYNTGTKSTEKISSENLEKNSGSLKAFSLTLAFFSFPFFAKFLRQENLKVFLQDFSLWMRMELVFGEWIFDGFKQSVWFGSWWDYDTTLGNTWKKPCERYIS